MLIWHKQNIRAKVTTYLWWFVYMVVGITVISFLEGDGGFDWVPYWQIWVTIAVVILLPTAPLSYWAHSAGSDWYQYQIVKFRVARRGSYVKLYELTEIRCEFFASGWHLKLVDQRGKGPDQPLINYQHDRRMWALIYNGILHSAAAGAIMDDVTIKKLELDQVPELYEAVAVLDKPEEAAGADDESSDARRDD